MTKNDPKIPAATLERILAWQRDIAALHRQIEASISAVRDVLAVPDDWQLRPDGVFVEPVTKAE